MNFRIFCTFILLIITLSSQGQKKDTTNIIKHSPRKATIMSAVLPGLGQAYNHKYWKIPIIYAGFGACAYLINTNTKFCNKYKLAYKYKNDNDINTIDVYPFYSNEDILLIKNYYRRNLDLSYIIMTAIYLLNILDASVDANLYDFNVNDDLSLHWKPSVINTNNYGMTAEINFTLSFNKPHQKNNKHKI